MPLAAIFSSSHFPSNPSPPEKPWLSSSPASGGGIAGVRMPTAPWMTSPLILPADQILDLSKPRKKNRTADEDNASDRFLSSGVRGGRSREAMRKILKSVSLLRKILAPPPEADSLAEDVSVDFALPLNGLDTISASDTGEGRKRKQPWAAAKEEKLVIPRVKKKRILPKAEMVLPAEELERLRGNAMKMRKWVRGKKAGVTPEVMKGIRKAWRKNELAVVKIVDPLRQNMVRAHEIVETKTGGLVVWRKKDVIVVLRGDDHQMSTKVLPSPTLTPAELSSWKVNCSNGITNGDIISVDRQSVNSFPKDMASNSQRDTELIDVSLYEREVNRLLDGLGPRFIDWWRPKPLPVDADLLPDIVPGFKTSFRLCPPNEWKRLYDDDLTYLRKLARPLPTHFALSKNTKLQGLACAIMKLWEKSLIAKIAIKVGVQNTNSQQMARELKGYQASSGCKLYKKLQTCAGTCRSKSGMMNLASLVQEEVERGLVRRACLLQRLPQMLIEEAKPSSGLQLIFKKPPSLPVFTENRIEDDDGFPLEILLTDTATVNRQLAAFPSSAKVEIVVLDGDFPYENSDNYSSSDFNRHIVKERRGRRPLLTGDTVVTLKDGSASIDELKFTDNSSWIRSRNFRLAVRVLAENQEGLNIREAVTGPFMVKDHRGESYKKHYPPLLGDEVWRLEKIGKDGIFHKRLMAANINTVQDFLKLSVVDSALLQKILGMSNTYWVAAVSHARTCPLGGKLYVHHGPHYAIVLNPICEVVNIEVDGVSWTFQELSLPLRATVQNLVSEAYNSWDSFEEISLPLATGEPVNRVAFEPHQIEGYFEVGLLQNEEQMGVYNSTQVMPNILL